MFKRFLVLAFALALFIAAFFVHQYWFDATQVAGKFRAEREKFHVNGQDLTTLNPPTAEPLTPTPSPIPVTPTADGGAYPAGGDSSAPTPAVPVPAETAPAPGATPAIPLDSNTLVNPATPDSSQPTGAPMNPETPGTAPTPPSTNSAPDSTLIYPGMSRLPTLLLGSFTPQGLRVQATPAAPASAVSTPAPTPTPASTNAQVVTPPPAPEPAAAPAAPLPAGTQAASVIVLGYHQFTPPGVRAGGKFIYTMPQDVFEYEMKYLKDNHYNVVPLSDVVAFAKHEKTLPPNTVAVTIDDGYKSAIVYAAPILKKYGFPWTFFVYPSFITRTEGRGAASWPDLVELQKEGVDIECHSMTHPNLKSHFQHYPGPAGRNLSPDEYDAFLTNEVVTSKSILEKELGKTIKYFAYPYGNYNPQVQAKAIAAGYEAIFTVANNPIHPGTNVYAMGRYIITTPVEKAYVAYLREGALGLADITPEPGAIVTDPRPVISAVLGYSGTINPQSISCEVRDMGEVKFDFDPKTDALRLYLPRDLIDSNVVVNVRAKDASSGQTLTASWRFNYQPTAPGVTHQPIGAAPATNAAAGSPAGGTTTPAAAPASAAAPATNAAASLAAPAPGTASPVMTNTTAAPVSTKP